jgi:hypothetical protein
MNLHRTFLGSVLLACVAVALAPATSSAQDAIALGSPDALAPERATLFGELGFGTSSMGKTSLTSLSIAFGARFKVAEPIALSVDWGFSDLSISASGRSASGGGIGNPFVAFHYLLSVDRGVLDFGAGLAAPLSSDELGDVIANQYASAIHGGFNLWQWSPNSVLPMVVPVRGAFDWDSARLAFDTALAVYVPLEGDADTDVHLQAGVQAGPAFGAVEFGARFQVFASITDDGDNAQLSTGPYVRAAFGSAFVGGWLCLNLDEPLGFAFDEGKVWGLLATGGGSF